MKEASDQFEERLEELLLNKSFESLSEAERNYALQFVTESEYRQYRRFLLDTRQSFREQDPLPSQPPQPRLAAALKARRRPSVMALVRSMASYRMPVWQTGLALLLLTLFFLKREPVSTPDNTSEPVYVQRIDTIIREVPVYVDTLSGRAAARPAAGRGIANNHSVSASSRPEKRSPGEAAASFNSRSFTNDPELLSYLVEIGNY